MLSQLERLSRELDGRYASDAELAFVIDYVRSFNLRVQTYQKLQELESTIVQQACVKMRAIDPGVFVGKNQEDLTRKCVRDLVYGLRATALAVLLNDPDALQEELLLWLQTIMRSLGKSHVCDIMYSALQDVIKQHLTPPQANLVCPLLESNRRILGPTA
ncbi:phycobilisome protein [Leptolyngbya sp. 7M]|uniref:Phycobilisome protein n=1 Tax=Leptolyngbya sp. NK1-12 TaxID=2547451 RepID=A0AA96WCZ4_9CYAN|nr:phycobilisome protein [Leptolyngbya sp. 7M]QYO64259.1 phycobilisome protein [Leptolyngbya sp. 7M]WNZ22813.1 phycobilisome protein [Leptolyngbya sp. NK1-12]